MLTIINKVFNIIKSTTTKDKLYIFIICLLMSLLYFSCADHNSKQNKYENNIKALDDTILYYKSRTDKLVATKTAFECNIKDLKKLNKSLYSKINDLKVKNNVISGVHIIAKVINPETDTVYFLQHDSIFNNFNHNFAFNNEWRKLEGIVSYIPDSLRLNITKDETYFDYTFAVDDKNKLYIKSSNPYIKYNEFTGFTIPTKNEYNFKFNVYGEYKYNFNTNKATPILGTEAIYKGISSFYEYDIVNKHNIMGIGYKLSILKH